MSDWGIPKNTQRHLKRWFKSKGNSPKHQGNLGWCNLARIIGSYTQKKANGPKKTIENGIQGHLFKLGMTYDWTSPPQKNQKHLVELFFLYSFIMFYADLFGFLDVFFGEVICFFDLEDSTMTNHHHSEKSASTGRGFTNLCGKHVGHEVTIHRKKVSICCCNQSMHCRFYALKIGIKTPT